MSETETKETKITVKTLDRTSGKLVDPTATWTQGNGATLSKAAKVWADDDREAVNDDGKKVEKNGVDMTVHDNITGATRRITADATIGLDTEGVRFNAYGTKNLLRVALLRSGCTRGSLASQLMDAIASDDVPAMCALMGVSEDALSEVDDFIKTMGEESRRVVRGRQQVSNLTIA